MEVRNIHREDVTDLTNCSGKLNTSLQCKRIIIGTYSFEPKDNVTITSKGVKIVAPLCDNASESCSLNINKLEVPKVIAHVSKNSVSDSVLCLYTLEACAQYIMSSLKMKDATASPRADGGLNFEPQGPHRMRTIIMQFEAISEQAITVIKSIWDFFKEISLSQAQDLVERAAQATAVHLNPNEIRQLLIYPTGKGGISINTKDFMCLAADQYLNDIIIDFYLKWIHNNIIPENQRENTFIFSSFFYKRLTWDASVDKKVKQKIAQKRHARVQNWTKNVNLFEKDFIIIPINVRLHWFLAIICFPKLKGPVTFDTNTPVAPQQTKKQGDKIGNIKAEASLVDLTSEEKNMGKAGKNSNNTSQTQAIKQPLILIFDSLAGTSRSYVFPILRDYLTCEYKLKMPENNEPHTFNNHNMPGHCVKVPQQKNFTDCGIYLLQYVEHFFKDPIKDYRLPIKQLTNWFDIITVTKKRKDIAVLLQKLINEKNGPYQQLILPEIPFPTLEGQLAEQEKITEEEAIEKETVEEENANNTTKERDFENTSDELDCKPSTSSAAPPPTHRRKFVQKRDDNDNSIGKRIKNKKRRAVIKK